MSTQSLAKNLLKWLPVPTGILLCCILVLRFDDWIDQILGSNLNVWWLFEGTRDDFQAWFPRFHVWAFWSVKLVPIIMTFLTVAFVYRTFSQIGDHWSGPHHCIPPSCLPVIGADLRFNLIYFSLAVFAALFIFLVPYVAVRSGVVLDESDPFQTQLMLSRGFALSLLALILVSIVVQWKAFTKLLTRFFLVADSPHNLALLRILFFGFMAITCWLYPNFQKAYFELEPQALPFMQWYIELVNLSADQYVVTCRLAAVVNFFIAIGLFTTPMLVVNSVFIFVVIATPNFYGKLFHQHLWIWIPWILTFSRCADVFSVDALIKKNQGAPSTIAPSIEYGLPLRLIWITFGVVYFFPGFQKLWEGGFDWALTDSMLNQIYVEWQQHYGWRSAIPVERFPWLVKTGGLVVILFEIAYIFLLLTKSTRWVAIVGGLIFHVITGLTLRIWFPPVLWMYVFYVNWAGLFGLSNRATVAPWSQAVRNRMMIGVTATLFFFNSLFGFAAIYSYPFTSFPGYSQIYSGELEVLVIEMRTGNGQWQNIDLVLEKANYRREDNTPYEQGIIDKYQSAEPVNKEIRQYWKLLCSNVSELSLADQYRFKVQLVPLHPDRKGEVLSEEEIFSSGVAVTDSIVDEIN